MITKMDIDEGLAEYYEGLAEVVLPNHVGEHFVRFMSANEFDKLMRGELISNKTIHSNTHQTGSVGACFVPIEGWEYKAESCVTITISGTSEERICKIKSCISLDASADVAVVFRNVGGRLIESYGRYADIGSDWDAYASVKEASTTKYDAQAMLPIAAYTSDAFWVKNCVYPIFEREKW